MAYNIYIGEDQDLFDLAIQEYQDFRKVMVILEDNALEVDAALSAGQQLQYRDEMPALLLDRKGIADPPAPRTDKRYLKVVEEGQDLFDLAIQEYGEVRFLPMFLFDNFIDPDVFFTAGQSLSFRDVIPEGIADDSQLTDWFRRNNIRVNTHAPGDSGWWETIDGEAWETQDGNFWKLQPQ